MEVAYHHTMMVRTYFGLLSVLVLCITWILILAYCGVLSGEHRSSYNHESTRSLGQYNFGLNFPRYQLLTGGGLAIQ